MQNRIKYLVQNAINGRYKRHIEFKGITCCKWEKQEVHYTMPVWIFRMIDKLACLEYLFCHYCLVHYAKFWRE